MKNLTTLLKMEFIFTKRALSNFAMGLGFPVIFFILFSGMQQFDNAEIQTRVIKDMLISMTAFSSISFALFSLPLSIREDETNNYLHLINNSPIKLSEYYIARFIRIIFTFIIAVVVVFVVGHFLRDVNMSAREWIMAGVLMVVGCITFLGIGVLLSLIKSVEKLIKGLWWNDFELLRDLVFSKLGWQRYSVLGKTEKGVDLDLYSPSTQKRVFVQIKSDTDIKQLDEYVSNFESEYKNYGYSEMYYVYHSGLENIDEEQYQAKGIKLVNGRKMAELVISAGLVEWLINKRS